MLKLEAVSFAYDSTIILNSLNLEVPRGEILVILGPSGCGKTTLLRLIAGLERAQSGRILFDGHMMNAVSVHQRQFGLMFQDYALFPHLTVEQNVAFGLRMRGQSAAEYQARVREVLSWVGLGHLAQRNVAQLSGGERQRVALARSLAPNPRLLMLDEPLASLDAALREQLATELRGIVKNAGVTTLYVTHDQQEAYAIADRIAIMNHGQFEQIDEPFGLYSHPQTRFAAQFLGLDNLIPVHQYIDGKAHTPLGVYESASAPSALFIHPQHIQISHATGTHYGVVRERIFRGGDYRLVVDVCGVHLRLLWTALQPAPPTDQNISLILDPQYIYPLFE